MNARVGVSFVEYENLREAWRRGFWTGLLLTSFVWCAILIGAMFLVADAGAQELDADIPQTSLRQQMMEEATQAALAEPDIPTQWVCEVVTGKAIPCKLEAPAVVDKKR